MMLNNRERLNQAIAVSAATGKPVDDPSLVGLGSKCVSCADCNGTGLPTNAVFGTVKFCKSCNGRGFVSVAKPKPCAYELPLKKEINKNAK